MQFKRKTQEELESIIHLVKLKSIATLKIIQTWKMEMVSPFLAIIAIYIDELPLLDFKKETHSEKNFINSEFCKLCVKDPVRLHTLIQNTPKLLNENKIKLGNVKFAQFLAGETNLSTFTAKTPLNQIMNSLLEFIQRFTKFYFLNCVTSTGNDFSFAIFFEGSKRENFKLEREIIEESKSENSEKIEPENSIDEDLRIVSARHHKLTPRISNYSLKVEEAQKLIEEIQNESNISEIKGRPLVNFLTEKLNKKTSISLFEKEKTIKNKTELKEILKKENHLDTEYILEEMENIKNLEIKNENKYDSLSKELKCEEIVVQSELKLNQEENKSPKISSIIFRKISTNPILKSVPFHHKNIKSVGRFQSANKLPRFTQVNPPINFPKSSLNTEKSITNTVVSKFIVPPPVFIPKNNNLPPKKKLPQNEISNSKIKPDRIENKSLTPVINKLRYSFAEIQSKNNSKIENKCLFLSSNEKDSEESKQRNSNNSQKINKEKIKEDVNLSSKKNEMEKIESSILILPIEPPKLNMNGKNLSNQKAKKKPLSVDYKKQKSEFQNLALIEDFDIKANLSHYINSEIKRMKSKSFKRENSKIKSFLNEPITNNLDQSLRQTDKREEKSKTDKHSFSISKNDFTKLSNFRSLSKKKISDFDHNFQSKPKSNKCDKNCANKIKSENEIPKKIIDSIFRKNATSRVKEYIQNPSKSSKFLSTNKTQIENNEIKILTEKKRLNELIFQKNKMLFEIEKEARIEIKKSEENIEDMLQYNQKYVSSKVEGKS